MLMKIAVLVFIIFTIMGYKNMFNPRKLHDKNVKSYKETIAKNGFTTTFVSTLIITIIFGIYFTLLYYNIGKINELLAWLSAVQMVSMIYNSFRMVGIISEIGDGKEPKPTSRLYSIPVTVFDTFYISLAIMYMYLV